MRFDANYREYVTLKDGREVLLRLLRPTDKARLARGFNRLSEEGRYRRFLGAKNKLSSAELEYLTDVDQQSHVAIGAVFAKPDGSEGEGAGVARFVCIAGRDDTADTAVTVADNAQGQGLGTILFNRLSEAAIERGVYRFRGEVLADNDAMLKITRGLARRIDQKIRDGVAVVEFDLPGAPPRDGDGDSEEQSALLRLFGSGRAVIREFLAWKWPLRAGDEEE